MHKVTALHALRVRKLCVRMQVQGGDPTGAGTGGESIYGPTFADEVDQRLRHDRRGVLAMANSGKHTNGSQFYILYKSAAHLDGKHTVFGAVVGALETLTAIESVQTDANDKPVECIEITGASYNLIGDRWIFEKSHMKPRRCNDIAIAQRIHTPYHLSNGQLCNAAIACNLGHDTVDDCNND